VSRITSVANQKGGVGKTTTAHALATGLVGKGKRVLAVDIDPQANLTFAMGGRNQDPGVYEVMRSQVELREAIQHLPQGDLLPSSLRLVVADMEFTDTGREFLLKKQLKTVTDDYDYIIIDVPPSLGILAINALTVCNDIVIPMGADIFSLQGLSQFYVTIQKVIEFCNPDLAISGLLITRYNGRTIHSQNLKSYIEEQAKQIGARVYSTVIREGIAVRESQTQKASIFTTDVKSKATQDYQLFINEYMEGCDDNGTN